jgi:CRP/FNR family transcriptional regulator, cyclic AMP receptor protein
VVDAACAAWNALLAEPGRLRSLTSFPWLPPAVSTSWARYQEGKEAIIAILGAGDFFGEGCLAGQPLRIGAAVAFTACSVMRLDRSAMIRVLHEQPVFSELFVSHLLARNIRIEEDLIDQLFNSSEKRLARLLLLLANFGKEGQPQPVIPRMSQETLAEMIGTTRSRVSFFMNKFRRLGFIDYNGGLIPGLESSDLWLAARSEPWAKRSSGQDFPGLVSGVTRTS